MRLGGGDGGGKGYGLGLMVDGLLCLVYPVWESGLMIMDDDWFVARICHGFVTGFKWMR